ncbi:RepB family plasmid replication initiator protein, partial [Butyricicoccus sp. 1XD8-22]
FTKEELLRLFAVEDTKSYIRNSSTFKKRVLDPVIDDLNNFTEMDIRYEELKSGRITTGYKFFWSFGKVVKLASKKQIDDLLSYVDTILRGMDSVLTLPKSKRLEALDIFDEVTKIKEQVNFNLEEAKVEGLKMLLKQYLTRYQELYLIKEEEKKVPFYNWLEERE